MSEVKDKILQIAKDVYSKIITKKRPELKMPIRSLNNVKYNDKNGYFELVGKAKGRTLTASK